MSLVAALDAAPEEEGKNMQRHTSHIASIKAIHEHVLVPGESHKGLWLGPGLLFKPGAPPDGFHFFFAVSDRKGGDSVQRIVHFVAPRPPEDSRAFSTWRSTWKRRDYPESLHEKTDAQGFRFVPTFSWKFHPASGKALAFGHVLRHRGKKLSKHLEHLAISYAVHDPANGSFTPWKSFRIKIDEQERPCVAYGQRVDLANGDILLPFSTIKKLKGWNSIRWCGSARCRFDGENVNVIEIGNLVTHPVPRGFVEPSMAEHRGTFYMTLRAQDGHSHVTTSKDGLTWETPRPWSWDNGDALPMDQTMTKFVSRKEGLFLVYTRITQDNKNVFRHRAPVFIAQIDPSAVRLIRKTESTLLGNNGFPLGNFSVHEVSPRETWVTAPEWDRTGRDIPCDNRLARIIWE
jgi:hypothetical protein